MQDVGSPRLGKQRRWRRPEFKLEQRIVVQIRACSALMFFGAAVGDRLVDHSEGARVVASSQHSRISMDWVTRRHLTCMRIRFSFCSRATCGQARTPAPSMQPLSRCTSTHLCAWILAFGQVWAIGRVLGARIAGRPHDFDEGREVTRCPGGGLGRLWAQDSEMRGVGIESRPNPSFLSLSPSRFWGVGVREHWSCASLAYGRKNPGKIVQRRPRLGQTSAEEAETPRTLPAMVEEKPEVCQIYRPNPILDLFEPSPHSGETTPISIRLVVGGVLNLQCNS